MSRERKVMLFAAVRVRAREAARIVGICTSKFVGGIMGY